MPNRVPMPVPAALAFSIALGIVCAMPCRAAAGESSGVIVELETPLQSMQPLQGLLRQPSGKGPLPAVVLLHGCDGNWQQLDERWGKLIARWGFVTLTIDSFGPRGWLNTCTNGAPVEMAHDAYRALDFLVRQPLVDPLRVAVLGFAQGGWLALTSVERGIIERTAPNKFRAAIAFYPPCLGFKGEVTVPTLILIGERDDWTLASECRNVVDGTDDFGISRHKMATPITLIVLPHAYHGFDVPEFGAGVDSIGHHLEYDKQATEGSAESLRAFIDTKIGVNEQDREPAR